MVAVVPGKPQQLFILFIISVVHRVHTKIKNKNK